MRFPNYNIHFFMSLVLNGFCFMDTEKSIRCSERICHWQWSFLIRGTGMRNIEEIDKSLNFKENSQDLWGPPSIHWALPVAIK
jgi:hypothetical protein